MAVSIAWLAPLPSGANQWPTIWDANAPCAYGKSPVLIWAPRYSSSVAMTRKISSRTSHAAPVCEPEKRDLRPSVFGLLRSRITAKVPIPTRTATREQVLDEADERPVPDPRERERLAEQVPVGLDDRQEQDREAPEGQEVRDAGDGPFQQLALAENLGGLGLRAAARMLPDGRDPLRGGLAAPAEPVEPPQPAAGDREGDHGQGKSDDDPQRQIDLRGRRWVPAYAGRVQDP